MLTNLALIYPRKYAHTHAHIHTSQWLNNHTYIQTYIHTCTRTHIRRLCKFAIHIIKLTQLRESALPDRPSRHKASMFWLQDDSTNGDVPWHLQSNPQWVWFPWPAKCVKCRYCTAGSWQTRRKLRVLKGTRYIYIYQKVPEMCLYVRVMAAGDTCVYLSMHVNMRN